jgi:hypothetical protein
MMAANSGVPANPNRIGLSSRSFGEFFADVTALQSGQVVDEKAAFEMVTLVLNNDRQESLGIKFLSIAQFVEG